MTKIRHVFFDAFATLVSPRQPIHIQYAQVSALHGIDVDPLKLKKSFKTAFIVANTKYPTYGREAGMTPSSWWTEVVSEALVGAGVPATTVQTHLPHLAPALIHRFSTKQGYTLHPDVLPTFLSLRSQGITISGLSNSDPRIRNVLTSLGVCPWYMREEDVVTSWDVGWGNRMGGFGSGGWRGEWEEEEGGGGVEGVRREECLHVGDDLHEDYHGAKAAGIHALLLRRQDDISTVEAYRDAEKDVLSNVQVVVNLEDVALWTRKFNS